MVWFFFKCQWLYLDYRYGLKIRCVNSRNEQCLGAHSYLGCTESLSLLFGSSLSLLLLLFLTASLPLPPFTQTLPLLLSSTVCIVFLARLAQCSIRWFQLQWDAAQPSESPQLQSASRFKGKDSVFRHQ